MQQGGVFNVDGYEALESIGSGSFGLIRKVRRKADGKILARKEIDYRRMSQKEKEQLVSEVNILRDLKHPNIVEFLERVIDRENSFIYILMEYCEGGDLASVIKRHREKKVPIPEEFVWSIMTQLILALHECHCGVAKNESGEEPTARPILHRDLKPDNVFLDAKKNVKLGDFGLSRSLTNPQRAFAQTYVGTPYYMSPELISDSSYDVKSDIWSLGCIVFEMCALEPPFLADTQAELDAKIRLGRVPSLPAQYSQELGLIVRSMLQVNPRKRPTTADLLANSRIRLISRELELKRRVAELETVQRSLVERESKVKEKEAFFAGLEKNFKAADQRLREMETVLNTREEAIRAMESTLVEREKTLSWEQQRLEEMRRNLIQEQERRQAALLSHRSASEKHTEPMAIDHANPHEGINGKSNTIFSSISVSQPSSTSHTVPHTTSSNTFDRYSSEPLHTIRVASRRKTGLSAGRYSLQPTPAYRSTGTTGTSANGMQIRGTTLSSSDAVDIGTTSANGQPSGVLSSAQRPSTHEPSGLSERSNITQFSFSGQQNSYLGTGGKEFQPVGRSRVTSGFTVGSYTGSSATTASSTEPTLRMGRPKSTSALIATLSSTSLSGASSSNPSSSALFAAPKPSKPSSTLPGLFFNFTPVISDKALSPSSTESGQGTALTDTQTPATTEPSSTLSNGISFSRPSTRSLAAVHSQPSASSAVIPPRRAHTPGLLRANPTPTSSSSSSSKFNTNLGATATTTASSSSLEPSSPPRTYSTAALANERTSQDTGLERPSRQDEDIGMEWDDIPSPFIKKTRPPIVSTTGPHHSGRTLFGS